MQLHNEVEVWKDIKDFEGLYQVSNLGNVKSLNYNNEKREQLLKQQKNKYGYMRVTLSNNRKLKYCNVHRLVAITFIPNHLNKPCVNHKNSIRHCNNVENLEHCTYKENTKHRILYGVNQLGSNNPNAKLTKEQSEQIKKMYATGNYSTTKLAKIFNCGASTIGRHVRNESFKKEVI